MYTTYDFIRNDQTLGCNYQKISSFFLSLINYPVYRSHIDIIINLQKQLNKKEQVKENDKVDNTNSLLINNYKELFTNIAAGQRIKYLELESFIGKDLAENIKEGVSISNCNSFLEITNKVINNTFPLFLEI